MYGISLEGVLEKDFMKEDFKAKMEVALKVANGGVFSLE
jgi:hypothetical protein